MDNNNLLYALLIGGGIYLYTKKSTVPGTHLPPGYTYNGFPNNSNESIYVNLAGQIFNTLGQLVGNILDYTGSQGYTGGNANPDSGQGHWADVDGEYVWVPNVSGPKVNCSVREEESPFLVSIGGGISGF